MQLAEILDHTLHIAREAGLLLKRYWGNEFRVELKGRQDIVTQADYESEALIIAYLREHYPDYGLVAEESGVLHPQAEYLWHIDPLDGTVNFAAGIPFFAVSISLVQGEYPLVGVVYDPDRDEMFWAVQGQGAFRNGKLLRVPPMKHLSDAVVHFSSSALKKAGQRSLVLKGLEALGPEVRSLINLGSAALSSCYVAGGRIDGVISWTVDRYAQPAGTLIAQEAGALATNLQGEPFCTRSSSLCIASPYLHPLLLEKLQNLAPLEESTSSPKERKD